RRAEAEDGCYGWRWRPSLNLPPPRHDQATRQPSVTDRRVALLRGINVGTAKRLAMADLRRVFEDLGYDDVRTLLNSGNVVFTARTAASPDQAARVQKAIADRLGIQSRVVVLTRREIADAVAANP